MNPSQFLLYTTPKGEVKIDTLWLSQVATLSKMETVQYAELDEKVVCSILELTIPK